MNKREQRKYWAEEKRKEEEWIPILKKWKQEAQERGNNNTPEFLYVYDRNLSIEQSTSMFQKGIKMECNKWLVGTSNFHRGCVVYIRIATPKDIKTLRKYSQGLD